MKAGDILLYTFESDSGDPVETYEAEILSVDPANLFFTFQEVNSGDKYTFQYSTNTSGPWQGQDEQGANYSIDMHDVYTAGATDPIAGEMALVTFADDRKFLCAVDSVSPSIDVCFVQAPYSQLSFDGGAVSQSNWDAYPVGTAYESIEGYVLETDLGSPSNDAAGVFQNGWWSLARQVPVFPGRIGGAIAPYAVVVHTTDNPPEWWTGLLHGWATRYGDGACAHFMIGRDADAANGVVQFGQITRNGNHAGGAQHGWFVSGGQQTHPNLVAVGIEVHCAGELFLVDGAWRFMEVPDDNPHAAKIPKGDPIPDGDVIKDPNNANHGWHTVTDYQYQQLGLLLDGLETVLGALPAGCQAQSVSQQPPAWAVFPTGRRVGHCSLDFGNRSDPWPATCDWIRARP
jgi:hypothetical protein